MTLSDPIWQVTLRRSMMDFVLRAMHHFTFTMSDDTLASTGLFKNDVIEVTVL